jgi:hypothetical protein
MSKTKTQLEKYLDFIAHFEEIAYDTEVDIMSRTLALLELAQIAMQDVHKAAGYLRDARELMYKHGITVPTVKEI